MAFWAGSGGGAESGILKCGTTMVVWERWLLNCGTTMVVWELWMLEWSPLQRSGAIPAGELRVGY